MEPIPVELSGVPETLLWNLGRRAAAARTSASVLKDPLAIEVADRLQYDFTDASRGAQRMPPGAPSGMRSGWLRSMTRCVVS